MTLRDKLIRLKPGGRVEYHDWRGSKGEGIFLRFTNSKGVEVSVERWGANENDGMIIKRDFSADEGRLFKPFLGDGDKIISLDPLHMAEDIHES